MNQYGGHCGMMGGAYGSDLKTELKQYKRALTVPVRGRGKGGVKNARKVLVYRLSLLTGRQPDACETLTVLRRRIRDAMKDAGLNNVSTLTTAQAKQLYTALVETKAAIDEQLDEYGLDDGQAASSMDAIVRAPPPPRAPRARMLAPPRAAMRATLTAGRGDARARARAKAAARRAAAGQGPRFPGVMVPGRAPRAQGASPPGALVAPPHDVGMQALTDAASAVNAGPARRKIGQPASKAQVVAKYTPRVQAALNASGSNADAGPVVDRIWANWKRHRGKSTTQRVALAMSGARGVASRGSGWLGNVGTALGAAGLASDMTGVGAAWGVPLGLLGAAAAAMD